MLKLGNKLGQKLGKKSSNRKTIMMRCLRNDCVIYEEEGENNVCKIPDVYGCYEYFLIDLKGGRKEIDLERYCEPVLEDMRGPGTFICLGSFIYSIPLIKFSFYENIPDSFPYPETGEMVNRLKDMVVTTLDKVHNPKKWTTSSSVPMNFRCAALSGTIYGLKSGNISIALSFHPSENRWTPSHAPPPPNLDECSVTGKMIPDPINDRILVHLTSPNLPEPSLYAWHPKMVAENGEAWQFLEFISRNLWVGGTTLINIDKKSLLFFFFNDYKDFFRVWCLEDHKFSEIRWCNEPPRLELDDVQESSMCYLGNNLLCLALSIPVPDENVDCQITFLIFHINRLSNSDNKGKGKGKEPAGDASSDSITTITYVSSKSARAEDTEYAVDITSLGDVY